MQNPTNEVPWSLYWSQDRLHSCVASGADSDQKKLDEVWVSLSKQLPAQAKVLDLACGNGAVAAALLSASPDLMIDAVDQADIAPQQFLSANPELAKVVFHANTDVNDLNFEVASFDALTSQFGIEYAGLVGATEASIKVLRSGGVLCFIIHHRQSAIIESSRLKLSEMRLLLAEGGLIESLLCVLRGEVDFAALETIGADYLAADNPHSEQISGQVFKGINQIATTLQSNPVEANNLGATLKLRLASEYQRLLQMDDSAQDEDQIEQYQSLLESNGFEIDAIEPFYADYSEENSRDQYLLGWRLLAKKS